MGPLLLSRLLNLNDVQSGVLSLIFKIADENGLLLLDLKDLRSMAQFVGDNQSQFKTQYGNISTASIGAIQRGLLMEVSAAKSKKAEPKPQSEVLFGAIAKSAAHAIGSQVGRQLIRGVLGSLFGSGRRR